MQQLPPAYSAIKKEGVTAYKAARAGKQLELEPRCVELYDAVLLAVCKEYWDVKLCVSKGFYVRSFARDLGRQLGTAAHLGALRRTASGCITIEQASALPLCAPIPFIDPVAALGLPVVVVSAAEASNVQNGKTLNIKEDGVLLSGPEGQGIDNFRTWRPPPNRGSYFAPQRAPHALQNQKSSTPCPSGPDSNTSALSVISIVHEDRLLAIYEAVGKSGLVKPKVVIPGGIQRT